jgi:hypothetical protein
MYGDGGWFGGGPRAQVRRHFGWTDVHGLSVTPPYPYDGTAGPAKSYTFRFSPMAGDGIRILGAPGGTTTSLLSVSSGRTTTGPVTHKPGVSF